jgi:adenylosuccinate synthase
MKRARVVIGANFGDEGKGVVTDWLCSQGAGMVVRFNGGAQAGHTVVTPDGERHVFHHCGSGALLDVPTFLSQYFICNPILFMKERDELIALGFHPQIYAHPECLVTTFADMMINQIKENKRGMKRHGSCGVGVHETIQRSTVKELRITMSDLWNGGKRLEEQLSEICGKYSEFRAGGRIDDERAIHVFIECCCAFANCVNPLGIGQCEDPVFEGAQGLLLSQDNKEYLPHVTHSYTGMKNVRELCSQAGIAIAEIYYVSRTYLTRHGAGRLPAEDDDLSFDDSTNKTHPFQGKLRFAPLDSGLAERCRKDAEGNLFKTILTHCDQLAPDRESDFYCDGETRARLTAVRPAAIITV